MKNLYEILDKDGYHVCFQGGEDEKSAVEYARIYGHRGAAMAVSVRKFINYDADRESMFISANREGFFTVTAEEFIAVVCAGHSCSIALSDDVRDELGRNVANSEIAERVLFLIADHEGRGQEWVHGWVRNSKDLGTKIYFPSINAEATVGEEIKRGGTASVCHEWDGTAYIGPIHRVRFTTKKPHDWDLRDNVLMLHHVPAGGFAYINSAG